MLPSGRTTIDLLGASKFSVPLVPGPAKLRSSTYDIHMFKFFLNSIPV